MADADLIPWSPSCQVWSVAADQGLHPCHLRAGGEEMLDLLLGGSLGTGEDLKFRVFWWMEEMVTRRVSVCAPRDHPASAEKTSGLFGKHKYFI